MRDIVSGGNDACGKSFMHWDPYPGKIVASRTSWPILTAEAWELTSSMTKEWKGSFDTHGHHHCQRSIVYGEPFGVLGCDP